MTDEYTLFTGIRQILQDDHSLDALISQYDKVAQRHFDSESMNKLHGEICYLLALGHLRQGDKSAARRYAEEAIEVYERVNTDTLEKALPVLSIADLPEFMHEGVVRERVLKQLGTS